MFRLKHFFLTLISLSVVSNGYGMENKKRKSEDQEIQDPNKKVKETNELEEKIENNEQIECNENDNNKMMCILCYEKYLQSENGGCNKMRCLKCDSVFFVGHAKNSMKKITAENIKKIVSVNFSQPKRA